jgi:hypothetical protein
VGRLERSVQSSGASFATERPLRAKIAAAAPVAWGKEWGGLESPLLRDGGSLRTLMCRVLGGHRVQRRPLVADGRRAARAHVSRVQLELGGGVEMRRVGGFKDLVYAP